MPVPGEVEQLRERGDPPVGVLIGERHGTPHGISAAQMADRDLTGGVIGGSAVRAADIRRDAAGAIPPEPLWLAAALNELHFGGTSSVAIASSSVDLPVPESPVSSSPRRGTGRSW